MTFATRVLLVLGISLAVGSVVAVGSYGAASERTVELPLRALARPPTASDALPHKPGSFVGRVLISRRVATYTDRARRTTNVFIYEAKGRFAHGTKKQEVWFCVARLSEAGGGGWGCASIQNAAATFAGHPLAVSAEENPYDGEYVSGVAANDIQRVVLIENKGVRHNIPLSADNGFIYNCGTNGCAGFIDAYGQGGALLFTQVLHPLG